MASLRLPNALFFLQLSLLFSTSFTVYGDETLATYPPAEAPHPPRHHHHHHAPTPAPSHPPTPPPSHPPVSPPPTSPPSPPPVKPPTYPPVKPPSYPLPRKKVAVQGVVYCKSCKYRGVDTLVGAAPLAGAVVKLQCNNTKHSQTEQTKTDKNGYFFFMPQKLTTSGSHKCKVFIISSPLATCSVPTNLHGGAVGAILMPTAKPPVVPAPTKPLPFELFTVGPFAFEAQKKLPCHY
ncbi:Non-classical arabinogalactan protein 30 [Sesamum alatum]|uniref:Non-classical arabinogalactan protein 30 n=1 Tax=Sesamum alatum TaxID=300844 RepID=A0AAE2CZ31_9LAMI|nr:Non-classical arabinogalactan protein 30 [Sesamum alatum]